MVRAFTRSAQPETAEDGRCPRLLRRRPDLRPRTANRGPAFCALTGRWYVRSPAPQWVAACWRRRGSPNSRSMTTKSREYLFGSTVKAKAEQAATARKNADRLACEAWNARMLGFRGPAPPSPAIGD